MMSLLWLLAFLHGADPCSPAVEPPAVEVDQGNMEISISRSYGIPWSICAREQGGAAPVLRVIAKDGTGSHVLLEQTIELRDSLRDADHKFSATASGCRESVPNHRDPNAVLQGPVGSRRWYNRRTVEIELIAEGAYAPLAFKAQAEVFCRACADDEVASASYYMNDFDKNTTRLVITLDKARYECAKGGGRMMLRRYWAPPEADAWSPLRPYEVIDNLQDRLKPEGDKMTYEAKEPAAHFCRPGKTHLYELIGIDEYASLIHRNYGPSDAIHRSGIEFLRCK
jgi:hypothetical protein